jgi:competence protein ComEA
MSPSERRALFLLLSLAIAGHVVRRLATRPGAAPGAVELLSTVPTGSPAAHRDSAMRAVRPLEPGERIDLDRASAQEIVRLPRVGLTLAKRIVADRDANGSFGELAALDQVPGVGPGLLKVLEPAVLFSERARASRKNRDFEGVAQTTSIGAQDRGFSKVTDLNIASVAELDALPGIGPSRAAAIVRHRETRGPFLSVDSLVLVPGIGPAALRKLRPLVKVR